REVLARQDKSHAAIAGQRAADHYRGVILAPSVQDNTENFTRFVLLVPEKQAAALAAPNAHKMSIAMRLAHQPGALLASLQPFARHSVNLLKIESRPIHGRPWEYQFFLDVESDRDAHLEHALAEVRNATAELRVLGRYPAAKST
ncbi:MAG TPA: prephenate dehydratase domain-containing protein, partial [Candidatus Acidoferrum sp.]